MTDENQSYQALHRPSKQFASRGNYLEHELTIMSPRRWRPNLPFRDYRFEYEDWVPALAATIGKIVMVAAVVAAFAGPLGLSDQLVIATVSVARLVAERLVVVLFS